MLSLNKLRYITTNSYTRNFVILIRKVKLKSRFAVHAALFRNQDSET